MSTSGIPSALRDALRAAVEAHGGAFSRSLRPEEVTHLVALSRQGAKVDAVLQRRRECSLCTHGPMQSPPFLVRCICAASFDYLFRIEYS